MKQTKSRRRLLKTSPLSRLQIMFAATYASGQGRRFGVIVELAGGGFLPAAGFSPAASGGDGVGGVDRFGGVGWRPATSAAGGIGTLACKVPSRR